MVLKNFFFRENWIGSEVAGMKIAFFASFWLNMGPHFGPKKAKIWNSFSRILIFSPLERQKLYYYQASDLN